MRWSSAWLLLPLVVLTGFVAIPVLTRSPQDLAASTQAVEILNVEKVQLSPHLISLSLRADGAEPVRIAQVQVDGGYRLFTADPHRPVGPIETIRIDIPFPWIDGESHKVIVLTSKGVLIEHTIDVEQIRRAGALQAF